MKTSDDCRGESQEKERLEADVYDLVSHFGGSISAEHGIGVKKRGALGRSRSKDELSMMSDIQKAIDPNGILNRGRVY